MRLHQLEVGNDRITAFGDRTRLEISMPLAGVWRVRLHPSAGTNPLLAKHSFAVVTQTQPLQQALTVQGWRILGEYSYLELNPEGGFCLVADDRVVVQVRSWSQQQGKSSITWHTEAIGYYGFGEKTGTFNKKGRHLTFWNSDVLPHHPDTDPLYQSIPFGIMAEPEGFWGFFLDESCRSRVDLACNHEQEVVWEAENSELDMYFILGHTPDEIVERYTLLTGRAPLPPLWSLGMHQSRWGYRNQDEVKALIGQYRRHQLPLDVVHLDIDYMEGYRVFTVNRFGFPDLPKLSQWAQRRGVRLVCIIDPGVKQEVGYSVFDQGTAGDFWIKTWRGDVLIGEVWPKPAVFPDFVQPQVRAWWSNLQAVLQNSGVSGFWNDMNEPSCFSVQNNTDPIFPSSEPQGKTLPDNALHGSYKHVEVHNVYGLLMSQASFDGMRQAQPDKRPFVLTRAGFAGIQRYAAVWTGDNNAYWEHLESSIPMLLGLGVSGVPFVGSDIGGFAGDTHGELLCRWSQLGVFYPLMRNHSAWDTVPQEPWQFGSQYLGIIRKALDLRYRLLPYLYRLMEEAEQTGAPPMRPMLWHYPQDSYAHNLCDQFLWGANLLIAPILRPHLQHRAVYFPESAWMRLDVLEAGRIYSAGVHAIAAPLDQVPIFLKPGGIVPLQESGMLHTQSAHWQSLHWMVNTLADGLYTLLLDSGNGYGARQYCHLKLSCLEQRLELRFSGAALPDAQTLVLLGVPQGARVNVPYQQTEDALYVTVPINWSEVVVHFPAED